MFESGTNSGLILSFDKLFSYDWKCMASCVNINRSEDAIFYQKVNNHFANAPFV
jgi:hypothetical protein